MNAVALSGYLLGITGLVLTYIAWTRPRQAEPRLVWTWISSVPLVNEAASVVPSLQIAFREHELERLTLWTGKLWNAGPGPVKGADLRNLRLEFTGTEIFGAWATGITSEDNGLVFVAGPKERSVQIRFDFLNRGDGAEFVVLHGGAHSLHPELCGALVGGFVKRVPAVESEGGSGGIAPWIMLLAFAVGVPGTAGFLMELLQSDAATKDPAVQRAIASALFSPIAAIGAVWGFVMWMIAVGFTLFVRVQRRGEPTTLSPVQPPPKSTPPALDA